jgi:hypothetical protein
MYANLKVKVATTVGHKLALPAWEVRIGPDGKVTVRLDKPDHGESFAVPNGEADFRKEEFELITIAPDY